MARIKLEFYPNGKIKTYELSGFGLSIVDKISYNKDTEFIENELHPKYIRKNWL